MPWSRIQRSTFLFSRTLFSTSFPKWHYPDTFGFAGNVFAGATPILNAATGIRFVNQADNITDYEISRDQFALNGDDLGITNFTFQKGVTAQIATDANFIVQLDPFVNAPTAAKAIADNPAITAKEGAFVYFNTTLSCLAFKLGKANTSKPYTEILTANRATQSKCMSV